jgi:lysyl-tRNA synthetase class 2
LSEEPGPSFTPDVEEAEQRRRQDEIDALRARGVDPYPVRFERERTAASLHEEFQELAAGTETGVRTSVAGRLMLIRRQGKLIFATMRDGTGTIQLFVSQAEVGEEVMDDFEHLDLGDWVGAEGEVMATRRGELSVKVSSFSLLAKALRPLPDKWHGLSDVDTRFRRREVDLMVNEEARRVFQIRFAAVAAIRRFLDGRGFLEVETPVLHPVPGGAAARPFVTHHNALDMDLYLRIAPELYLKRLVVGGFERVYEIGRVFRNEGLSTRHNPEFTMLEAYQAFADYTDMMTLTEELVADAAIAATGSTEVEVDGERFDLTPPWPRRTLRELVAEHAGVDVHPSLGVDALRKAAGQLDVPVEEGWDAGKLVLEIYEKTTEAALRGPLFVLDYPLAVSPLARTHRDDPELVERFEVIVAGRELANAFSELNDPAEQRRRFEGQAKLAAMGDVEAHGVDEDYVRALEYGLPPCGGLGIGIDRLAMLLAGVSSIREVLLFPHLRPLG